MEDRTFGFTLLVVRVLLAQLVDGFALGKLLLHEFVVVSNGIDDAVPDIQVVLPYHLAVHVLLVLDEALSRRVATAWDLLRMLFARLFSRFLAMRLFGAGGILSKLGQVKHRRVLLGRLLNIGLLLFFLEVDIEHLFGQAQVIGGRLRIVTELVRSHLSEALLGFSLVGGGDLSCALGRFLSGRFSIATFFLTSLAFFTTFSFGGIAGSRTFLERTSFVPIITAVVPLRLVVAMIKIS